MGEGDRGIGGFRYRIEWGIGGKGKIIKGGIRLDR